MNVSGIPVVCHVENCFYNRNHLCHAHIIEISTPGGKAGSKTGTCCNTFIDRG